MSDWTIRIPDEGGWRDVGLGFPDLPYFTEGSRPGDRVSRI